MLKKLYIKEIKKQKNKLIKKLYIKKIIIYTKKTIK